MKKYAPRQKRRGALSEISVVIVVVAATVVVTVVVAALASLRTCGTLGKGVLGNESLNLDKSLSAGEIESALVVDGENLDHDLIADVDNVGDLLGALDIEMADVNKTFLARSDLNNAPNSMILVTTPLKIAPTSGSFAMRLTMSSARRQLSISVPQMKHLPSSSMSIFTPHSADIF